MRRLWLTVDFALLNADIQTQVLRSPWSQTLLLSCLSHGWGCTCAGQTPGWGVSMPRYPVSFWSSPGSKISSFRLEYYGFHVSGIRVWRLYAWLKQKSPSKQSYWSVSSFFISQSIYSLRFLSHEFLFHGYSFLPPASLISSTNSASCIKDCVWLSPSLSWLVQLTPLIVGTSGPLTNSAFKFHHLIRVLSNSFIHLLT